MLLQRRPPLPVRVSKEEPPRAVPVAHLEFWHTQEVRLLVALSIPIVQRLPHSLQSQDSIGPLRSRHEEMSGNSPSIVQTIQRREFHRDYLLAKSAPHHLHSGRVDHLNSNLRHEWNLAKLQRLIPIRQNCENSRCGVHRTCLDFGNTFFQHQASPHLHSHLSNRRLRRRHQVSCLQYSSTRYC